jgi:hypothetical protein
MNFFHHKDLGNHLLQLWHKVVKHPVFSDRSLQICILFLLCIVVVINYIHQQLHCAFVGLYLSHYNLTCCLFMPLKCHYLSTYSTSTLVYLAHRDRSSNILSLQKSCTCIRSHSWWTILDNSLWNGQLFNFASVATVAPTVQCLV